MHTITIVASQIWFNATGRIKYTVSVVDNATKLVRPYLKTGTKLQCSFVRELICPYMPKQAALDAQLVCNVLTMSEKKIKTGKFVCNDGPVFDEDSMDNFPGIDVASAVAEEVLDIIERTWSET